MMFPFAPQPAPTPIIAASPADSIELKSRKSTADRLFQAICGAIGGLAAHSARSAPQYFPLFVVGCVVGGLFLAFVPPRDRDFLGLHRSGAIILTCGALLPFWDLLTLIPQQVVVGAAIAVIVLAIGFIAILGRN
jgi:hypothetical protein